MMTFFLLLGLSAFAATESMNAFDKSYPKDNTFCTHKNKRVEFIIRGSSKFTESSDKGYGELLFYRIPNQRAELLPVGQQRSDTFRFFHGVSPSCSKSHAYMIDAKTLAVLLLKENKPYKDKLFMQLFNLETMTPGAFVETDYAVDKASAEANSFAVRTFSEIFERDAGRVTIAGYTYIYHEKEFPKWMIYNSGSFGYSGELTYKKFPWKKSFRDLADFYEVTGWSPGEKKFNKVFIYLAVNYQIRKRCLLFIDKKQPLSGTEAWRCQTI